MSPANNKRDKREELIAKRAGLQAKFRSRPNNVTNRNKKELEALDFYFSHNPIEGVSNRNKHKQLLKQLQNTPPKLDGGRSRKNRKNKNRRTKNKRRSS